MLAKLQRVFQAHTSLGVASSKILIAPTTKQILAPARMQTRSGFLVRAGMAPFSTTTGGAGQPVTHLTGLSKQEGAVLDHLSRDSEFDPNRGKVSKGDPAFDRLIQERSQALKQLDKYNQSENILNLINERLESVENAAQKKELKKLLAQRLDNQNLPVSEHISNQLQKQKGREERSLEQIIYDEAVKVEEGLAARGFDVIDSFSSGAQDAYERQMFSFVPSNPNERLPKHHERKIASYEEFRKHMVVQNRGKKELQELQDNLKEQNELLEKNAKDIERMGPLGIFEISQRVRESIAWTRGKRFAQIVDERVSPEEIVDGGYGSKYANPVPSFDSIYKDDLGSFRNKFLQFLANPDSLNQEYLPSIQSKTRFALQKACLDLRVSEQEELRDLIVRRYEELQNTLVSLEKQFEGQPEDHLENAVSNVVKRYLVDLKLLQEKQSEALKMVEDDQLLRDTFDIKDINKIESSVVQASEALKTFQKENMSELHPGNLGSEQSHKVAYYDRVLSDSKQDKESSLNDKLNQDLPYYSPEAIRNAQRQSLLFAEGEKRDKAREILDNLQIKENQEAIQSHLEQAYQQALQVEDFNASIRKLISAKLLMSKRDLQELLNVRDKAQKTILQEHQSFVENQILPQDQLQNYLELEKNLKLRERDAQIQQELSFVLNESRVFDPSSSDQSHYEQELKALSLIGVLQPDTRNQILDQYSFVMSCMLDNKVQMTNELKARTCEYAIMKGNLGIANNFIVHLSKQDISNNLINEHYLKEFFSKSLKEDNLDGIAYLVNYANYFDISVHDFPVNSFRSALDYYMNKNFNLSKVMTFVKFMDRYYQDRYLNEVQNLESKQNLTQNQYKTLSDNVFAKTDDLVDLDSLLNYLVRQSKDRQIIDPITRDDCLWQIIDNFTKDKDFIVSSQLTTNTKISALTMSAYLSNHLDKSSAYEKIFKLALRLEDTPLADEYCSQMIKTLRNFSLKNEGKLPRSFTKKEFGSLYYNLKKRQVALSPRLEELLLFTMDKLQMDAEIVDRCQSQSQKQDVHKYYLSEALMRMDFQNKTYGDVLSTMGIIDSSEQDSACQITQKTKAFFLDSGADVAITYFKEQIKRRQETSDNKRKFFASLYDEAFNSEKPMTIEEFEAKYFSSINLTDRLLQEAYAVSKLKRIFENKDFDKIDEAFKLYSILREERQLAGIEYMLDENDLSVSQFAKIIPANQRQHLSNIRERKLILAEQFNKDDYESLKEVAQIMDNDKLEIFDGMSKEMVDYMLNMFENLATKDSHLILQSTKAIEKVKDLLRAQMRGKNNKTFDQVMIDVDELVDSLIPSQINITSQKGKLLRSRILSSALHQLGIEFDNDSDMVKQEKDREQKLGSDISVFKDFHNMLDELNQRSFTQILRQAYKKNLDMPLKTSMVRKMEEQWREEAKKRPLSDDEDSGLMYENKRKDNIFLDDYAQILGNKMYQEPQEDDVVPSKEDSDLEKARIKSQLSSLDEELSELKSQRDSLKAQVEQAEGKKGGKKQSKKKGMSLGDMAKIVEEDKSKENLEANKTQIKQLTEEITQLRNKRKGVKALLDKKEVPNAENVKDKKQELQEFMNEFIDIVREQREMRDERKNMMFTMDPKELEQYYEEKSKKKIAEFEERQKKGHWSLQEITEGDYSVDIVQEFVKSLDMYRRVQRDEIERLGDIASDRARRYNERRQAHLQENLDYMLDDEKGEAEAQMREEFIKENIMQEFAKERHGDKFEKVAYREAMKKLSDKYPNKNVPKTLDEELPFNPHAPHNQYQNPFEQVMETGIFTDVAKLRRKIQNKQRGYQTGTTSEEQGTYENEKRAIDEFNQSYEKILPGDYYDPYNVTRENHNMTLIEMKERLLDALNNRKQAVLPTAIQIFNKLQDKYVKSVKLDDYDEREEQIDHVTGFKVKQSETQVKDINQSINKLELLLNDSSSPILSAIKSSEKYESQKLPGTLQEYVQKNGGDIHNNPVDVNAMVREARKMSLINQELDKISHLTENLEDQIRDKITTMKKRTQAQAYQHHLTQLNQEKEKLRRANLERAYNDYLAKREQNVNNDPSNISMEAKVNLMKNLLSIELGEEFVNSADINTETSFPAFYAQDLIQFGIRKDVPGAIRLGEILLVENCANDPDFKMPAELSSAIRDYMFKHQDRYISAVQQTGPINNTSLYHRSRQEGDAELPMVFCVDDPYYQELIQKNYRREDMYKRPSIYAWDHKPHGILGEIFNMDELKRKVELYYK